MYCAAPSVSIPLPNLLFITLRDRRLLAASCPRPRPHLVDGRRLPSVVVPSYPTQSFTYASHVRSDHRLFIRHPSSTSIARLLIGFQLVQFGDGGYIILLTGYGGSGCLWMLVSRSWQAASVSTRTSPFRRCAVEERKRFGDARTSTRGQCGAMSLIVSDNFSRMWMFILKVYVRARVERAGAHT